jgi:hypothetical protein
MDVEGNDIYLSSYASIKLKQTSLRFMSVCHWVRKQQNQIIQAQFLDFRREVDEICVLLSFCAVTAYSGNSLPTFRNTLSVPELDDGADRFPERSVRNYHYTVRSSPQQRSSQIVEFVKTWRVVYWFANYFSLHNKNAVFKPNPPTHTVTGVCACMLRCCEYRRLRKVSKVCVPDPHPVVTIHPR